LHKGGSQPLKITHFNDIGEICIVLTVAVITCTNYYRHPALIHMDVMYAGNAGAFTCPPFGPAGLFRFVSCYATSRLAV
jgi:hypothetical protein